MMNLAYRTTVYQSKLFYINDMHKDKYMQYPIIRNGGQKWALEFLRNYQLPDADRFLFLQGWALAVS